MTIEEFNLLARLSSQPLIDQDYLDIIEAMNNYDLKEQIWGYNHHYKNVFISIGPSLKTIVFYKEFEDFNKKTIWFTKSKELMVSMEHEEPEPFNESNLKLLLETLSVDVNYDQWVK